MPVIHLSGAPLVNLQESVNAQGEIQISGLYMGTPLAQTLVCHVPCIIFFDTTNLNFYAISIPDYQVGWEFVEIVTAITQ